MRKLKKQPVAKFNQYDVGRGHGDRVYEPRPANRRGGIMCDSQEQAEQVADALNKAAQVSALTEQRDAAVAACKAVEFVEINHDGELVCPKCRRWHTAFKAPELRDHGQGCQLAAAIAMTEGTKE